MREYSAVSGTVTHGLDQVGQGKSSARAMLDELQTQKQQLLDEVVKSA